MSDKEWSLEGLNQAYQQGYVCGRRSRSGRAKNPYSNEVLEAAWESGFEDAQPQHPEEDMQLYKTGS